MIKPKPRRIFPCLIVILMLCRLQLSLLMKPRLGKKLEKYKAKLKRFWLLFTRNS